MNGLLVLLMIGAVAAALVVAYRRGWLHAAFARLRAARPAAGPIVRRRHAAATREAVARTGVALAAMTDEGWAGAITLPAFQYVWLMLPGRLSTMLDNPVEQRAFLAKVTASVADQVRRHHGAPASTAVRVEGMYALGGAVPGERVEVRLSTSRTDNPFEPAADEALHWPGVVATPGAAAHDAPRTMHVAEPADGVVTVTLDAAGEQPQVVEARVGEPLTIGRHPAADVVLPYLTDLSTWHLRLTVTWRRGVLVALVDDTSTYGTFSDAGRLVSGRSTELPLPAVLHLDSGRRVSLRLHPLPSRIAT